MIDYKSLSIDELQNVVAEAEREIAIKQREARKTALTQAEAIAKAAGFASIEDMLANAPARKKRDTKTIRYRNPENPEQTWTGNGRKPTWILEIETSGGNIEDFRV